MNSKYKIIALFGEAGSGKDYIQKAVMKTIWGKTHFNQIISCTTRPPREGEKDGVDYHFISSSEEFFNFENLQKWIEFTNFRNWWYGTSIDHLSKDKINIGVFNIAGIKSINEDEEMECFPIYIKTYPKIRLLRQLQRETEPDCDEIIRRYLTDKKDFSEIPFHYHIIENNTDEIQPIVSDIIGISRTMDKIN